MEGLKCMPERVDKALEWLKLSRDSWKAKAKEAKLKLKKQTLAVKRAREERDRLKCHLELNDASEMHDIPKAKELELENESLKQELAEARRQLEDSKKKR
jgi:hypothetical protein